MVLPPEAGTDDPSPARPFRFLSAACLGALLLLPARDLRAELEITPRLQAGEIWSSNVGLDPRGEEQASWVTELTPGIALQADGARSDLFLDLQLQTLRYSSAGERNATYGQGRLESRTELVRDWFWLDVTGSQSQIRNGVSGQAGADNISGGDRVDVRRIAFEPSVEHTFGSYLDARLRLRREWVGYSGELSDALNDSLRASMESGSGLGRLSWSASYRQRSINRPDAYDIDTRSAGFELRYAATRSIDTLAEVGYEYRDSLGSTSRRFRNGGYWGGGLAWTPNRRWTATVLGGDRYKRFSFGWTPSPVSALRGSIQDLSVGSNPGVSWNLDATFRRRSGVLQFGYFEQTVVAQELFLLGNCWDQETNTYSYDCSTEDGTFWEFIGEVYVLTDNEFLRKRGWAVGSLQGVRNSIGFSAYRETRTDLLNDNRDLRYGGSVSWLHRLGKRSRLIAQLYGRSGEYAASAFEDRLVRVSLVGERELERGLDVRLGISTTERQDRNGVNDYRENRVFLEARLEF